MWVALYRLRNIHKLSKPANMTKKNLTLLIIITYKYTVVVQSLSCVQLFATPWTAAGQASLTFTIYRSLHKPMSIELVMPFNTVQKVLKSQLYVRQQKRHRWTEQSFGLWERARVGWFGRMALKHVYYHMWNESPVQVWYMTQGAWGWCTGMTQRDGMGREVGEGSGWEHRYTHGGFMSMYGKTTTIL